jgi:hypothetical protein
MKINLAKWSLILLCFSMGAAIGGGLYEQIVLTPLWSASPPSSFSIIQPGSGVPLQNFWISGPRGDHYFHSSFVSLDMEAN